MKSLNKEGENIIKHIRNPFRQKNKNKIILQLKI